MTFILYDLYGLLSHQMLHFFKRLSNKVVSVFNFFRETNVILKLVSKVTNRCSYRPGSSIAKRANGISFYFALDAQQQIDVFFASVSVFDAVQYFFQPTGSFSTRRTLSAAFVVVKTRKIPGIAHNTSCIVVYNKSA